jgi:hypothetical protein
VFTEPLPGNDLIKSVTKIFVYEIFLTQKINIRQDLVFISISSTPASAFLKLMLLARLVFVLWRRFNPR